MNLKDLLNTDSHIYVYATGAGAGIQYLLWSIPGSSKFLIGCSFPYAKEQTEKVLGFTPASFVSEEMAINLATAAYLECGDVTNPIGIGLTASVASIFPHRGEHRVIVASVSKKGCYTLSYVLDKGYGSSARKMDGNFADIMGGASILYASGLINSFKEFFENNNLADYGFVMQGDFINQDELAIKLIMERPLFDHGKRLKRETLYSYSQFMNNDVILYPGSFNPLHFGHEEAANAVVNHASSTIFKGLQKRVVYCTTINPAHKPHLSVSEILDRTKIMKNHCFVLTENDPLFIDKARANPGAQFIIGADTLDSFLNPKWGIDTVDLLKEFYKLTTEFFVVGRLVDGEFLTLEDIVKKYDLSSKYEKHSYIFYSVPGRWDISSTEIRNKNNG